METEENRARERRLLEKARSGDRAAADALIEPHREMLTGYFNRAIRDKERAEDLAQDAVTAGFVSLARFRGDCPFSAFLLAIANNLLRKHLTRDPVKRGRETLIDTETTLEALCAGNETTESPVERQTADADFIKALREKMWDCCSDDERRTLDLIYQGESLNEIAEWLGMREATVRSHLLRGRGKLMAHLTLTAPDLLGGNAVIEQAWAIARNAPDSGDRPTTEEVSAWEIVRRQGPVRGKTETFRAACLKMARFLRLK